MNSPEREKVVSWIKRDPLHYRYLLDFYDTGAKILQLDEDAIVLVKEGCSLAYGAGKGIHPDERYLIMTDSREETQRLIETGHYVEDDIVTVYMEYYPDEDILLSDVQGVKFRDLDESDIPFVKEHYDAPAAAQPGVIEGCIADGMIGAEGEEGLYGFIGIHKEGAIGFLYVLPEYRKRGIAMELEKRMIRKQLDRGLLPYCHVQAHNTASLNLQKKIGMVCYPDAFYWFAGRQFNN